MSEPRTEPIEPVEFPCPNCGEGIVLRGHFEHPEAAHEPQGLDVERLAEAFHAAQIADWRGQNYTDAHEWAEKIAAEYARLLRKEPTDE